MLSKLDKKVINLIATSNLPFNLINSPYFKAICDQKTEQLKEETHYRRYALPLVYDAVRNKLLFELKQFRGISFTSDIWSENQSFIRLFLNFNAYLNKITN